MAKTKEPKKEPQIGDIVMIPARIECIYPGTELPYYAVQLSHYFKDVPKQPKKNEQPKK